MGETWKRLVFNMQAPRFELFSIVARDVFDQEEVTRSARAVQDRIDACPQCVDPHFTAVWIRRLLDPHTSRRAWRCLRNVLACALPIAAPVEKHLLGQAAKPRKRGRAMTATNLARATYVMSVKQAHDRLQKYATTAVLGKSQAVRRRFSQALSSFAVGRARRNRTVGAAGDRPRKVSTWRYRFNDKGIRRRVSAVDVFDHQRRPDLSAVSGETFGAKRRRLMALWRSATEEERAAAQAQADIENEALTKITFPEFCNRGENTLGCRKNLLSTVKRGAVHRTFQALQNHPCFNAGAAIQDFESGLRQDKA